MTELRECRPNEADTRGATEEENARWVRFATAWASGNPGAVVEAMCANIAEKLPLPKGPGG